jgi:hypothetical protein
VLFLWVLSFFLVFVLYCCSSNHETDELHEIAEYFGLVTVEDEGDKISKDGVDILAKDVAGVVSGGSQQQQVQQQVKCCQILLNLRLEHPV